MPRMILLFCALVSIAFLAVACDDGNGESDEDGLIEPPIDAPLEPPPPRLPQDETGGGPTNLASCTEASRVSWADAQDNVGREVALIGPVERVEQDSYGGQDGTALVVGYPDGDAPLVDVFVPERVSSQFGDLAERFEGQAVCVIGTLQSVEGDYVIVINEPADLVPI